MQDTNAPKAKPQGGRGRGRGRHYNRHWAARDRQQQQQQQGESLFDRLDSPTLPPNPGPGPLPHRERPPAPPPQAYLELLGEGAPSPLCVSILQQLQTGYECMVCCSDVRRNSATWSCTHCFRIFHLSCLRQWGKTGAQFRCPQCQHEYSQQPSKYTCFCTKVVDPPIDGHFVPHSCGNQCGRTRRGNPFCEHACTLRCHPGPCPKCEAPFDVECFCGKGKMSLPCSSVEGPFSCGEVCGRVLACGLHTCEQQCHEGECRPCMAKTPQACNCGANERLQACGDNRPWSCQRPCGRPLDCGNHTCSELCHTGDCSPCPSRPQAVKTCPCGKKPLYMLTPHARKLCTDPIPACGQVCGKVRACGVPSHVCKLRCHEGPCEDCEELAPTLCRCGGTKGLLPCALLQQLADEKDSVTVAFEGKEYTYPVVCKQKCSAPKNCGRHKCAETCCPVRRKGADDPDGLHLCTVRCGKDLPCGKHTCEERCHRGACPPCMHIVTEELHCPCGLTVLEPPQPCGTRLPVCNEPCRLERPCGHPNIMHLCHNGDCPPCTAIVEKLCVGGHMLVPNVPCHLPARCKVPCGKPLACGKHQCAERCHPGACPGSCKSVCGQLLPCGHTCPAPCHTGHCPEYCKRDVAITCPCGRRSEHVPCKQYQHLLRLAADKRGSVPLDQMPQLSCDANCEGDKRLQGLAAALGVREERTMGTAAGGLGGGAFHTTLWTPALYWTAAKSPQLRNELKIIESTLRDFVLSNKPTLLVPTTTRERRELLVELLPYYHIDNDNLEVPSKTVFLRRTPQTRLPEQLLSDLIQRGDYDPVQLGKQRLEKYPGAGLVLDRLTTAVTERVIVDYLKPFAGKYTLLWQNDSMCIAVFLTAQMRDEATQQLLKLRWPHGATPFNETLYPSLYGQERRREEQQQQQKKAKPRKDEPADANGWMPAARAAPSAPAPQRVALQHSKSQFDALTEE